MKFPVFLRVSLKYLWRYRRRYLFLFLALGFGFAVVTVISSLKDGMKDSLYHSAQSHYAGDITAIGLQSPGRIDHLTRTEMDLILASAERVKINPVSLAIRTTIFGGSKGTVFFNGNTVPIRYIVGVDWEPEKDYFDSLSYGEAPVLLDDTSVMLSVPVARELGARQGDSLILEVLTVTGQKNTGTFIIAGTTEDSSFFDYYKVFMSRSALNNLIGFAEDDCSLIGFFLKDKANTISKQRALYNELSPLMATTPLVFDRDGYNEENHKEREETTVLLITLPVYLSEVAQLMDAIDLASWVLYIMMLVIIMVSAGVTCRLILHERTRETGTMRAIGFYEGDVRFILELEIVCMAVFSVIAGFVLALFINWGLSYTSFGWVPGFEIFLQNGRLSALYLPGTIVVNILAVLCMLVIAIWGPIFRNSRNPLPQMLSGGGR